LVVVALQTDADTPPLSTPHPTTQLSLPRIELMPSEPSGFKLLNFREIARGYDRVVFGPESMLRWWDDTRVNMPARGVGLPSYIEHPEMKSGSNHEAITVLGSILGASVAGIDKRGGPDNIAAMSAQYFNSANGTNLVLNRVSTKTGQSYWYELFPQILFDAIAVRYPQEKRLGEITDIAAARWLEAFDVLAKNGTPSFEHISFDFATMTPVDNGKQREPDAAAALAYLFFNAYKRNGEKRFLDAANLCLKTLEDRAASPSYEVLMPFGAYAAARINAETEAKHDVGGLLNDFLEPRSDVRAGWGLIVGNWNGIEVSGLIGSVNDAGGYGFVMNTYATGMAMIPIARYDERYARTIAKWTLNAAGAIRYCYPGQLPIENTSKPSFTSDPPNVIAFEGIRRRLKGVSPLAGGDPTVYGWGPCDLGLYGSGLVGIFGGSISATSDPLVLQIDLVAADPSAPQALPTYLYYNPRPQPTSVDLKLGEQLVDLYDSIENRVVARGVKGSHTITLPADTATILVRLPAGARIVTDGRRSRVGETVFDYENGLLPPKPLPIAKVAPSKAKRIDVPKATRTIDGNADEWVNKSSRPIRLDTAGRGELQADVAFSWDDEFLYVLVKESHKGRDAHEAKDLAEFTATPWDFDATTIYMDLGNGERASLGDFVLHLGFGSNGQRDLAFSAQAPDSGAAKIQSVCTGSRDQVNRVIEARVAWKGMAEASFANKSAFAAQSGMAIGTEPMLVELNHTRQSFIGGSQYQRPTGTDANSVDLVLQP
jgi:hypothetical protein